MVFVAVFAGSICVITVGFMLALNRISSPGADFSPYRSSISVMESTMDKTKTSEDGTPRIVVVGLITNKSDIAWKNIEFDLRFFDRSGNLIDTESADEYYPILSHRDSGFRAWLEPVHPLSDYDSYKIYIGSARDARSLRN